MKSGREQDEAAGFQSLDDIEWLMSDGEENDLYDVDDDVDEMDDTVVPGAVAEPEEEGDTEASPERVTLQHASKVRSMVECLEELAPLFREADTSSDAPVDAVAGAGNALYQYVEVLAESLGLDEERLRDRYLIRRLALTLSPVVPNLQAQGWQPGRLVDILQSVHEHAASDDRLLDLLSREEESDDVLVSIRLGLLRPALRFHHLLQTLCLKGARRDEALAWLHQQAVRLAQDMAINWDRRAALYDREHLFTAVVGPCAEICIDSFVAYLVKTLSSEPMSTLTDEAIWSRCLALDRAIIDNPAGYGDDAGYPLTDLKNEFSHFLRETMAEFPWEEIDQNRALRNALRGHMLPRVESVAVYAWEDACQALISAIQQMSEEERKAWMAKAENQRPMPFSHFVRHFEQSRMGLSQPLDGVSLDYEVISHMASSQLAVLWGFSDAVCAIRSGEAE